LPIKDWHAFIGDPTIADAVCDRLFHGNRLTNPSILSFCYAVCFSRMKNYLS